LEGYKVLYLGKISDKSVLFTHCQLKNHNLTTFCYTDT
jgi:hypothetical protein